jgi:hypothetical protein
MLTGAVGFFTVTVGVVALSAPLRPWKYLKQTFVSAGGRNGSVVIEPLVIA